LPLSARKRKVLKMGREPILTGVTPDTALSLQVQDLDSLLCFISMKNGPKPLADQDSNNLQKGSVGKNPLRNGLSISVYLL
jgi:hypothetical protein